MSSMRIHPTPGKKGKYTLRVNDRIIRTDLPSPGMALLHYRVIYCRQNRLSTDSRTLHPYPRCTT